VRNPIGDWLGPTGAAALAERARPTGREVRHFG